MRSAKRLSIKDESGLSSEPSFVVLWNGRAAGMKLQRSLNGNILFTIDGLGSPLCRFQVSLLETQQETPPCHA